MKQSTTTIVSIFLAGCAIFLGQMNATAVARGSRGGEGGVADASNDCASAPNAIVGNNPFNTTGGIPSISFTGTPCGDYSAYNCKFFTFIPALTGVHCRRNGSFVFVERLEFIAVVVRRLKSRAGLSFCEI
ncbi:MAG: hypothetical protein O2875_05570 [Planctomycetota bacterium]|nr:hypothetical protein [Planctomycetota bacterium]MDA1261850.1 hypothetical protein [Planctomycetota bacterium]